MGAAEMENWEGVRNVAEVIKTDLAVEGQGRVEAF